MLKTLLSAMIAGSMTAMPVFAANFLDALHIKPVKNAISVKKKIQDTKAVEPARQFTDFSGTWHGTCSLGDMTHPITGFIIRNNESFLMAAGQINVIGDIHNDSSATEEGFQQGNIKLSWNADRTILEFHSVSTFSEYENASIGAALTKTTLSINDKEELIIAGTMHHLDTSNVEADTINNIYNCTLRKEA